MKLRIWTSEEFERALALHSGGWTAAEVAKVLGRTESAVRLKLISRGFSSKKLDEAVVVDPAPQLEASEAERIVEQRERRQDEKREQRAAIERVLEERLVEVVQTTLRDCITAAPIAPPPLSIDRQLDEPTSAVLLLGDLHVGKVCRPEESEGHAFYNPAVALARLHELEVEVARLLAAGPPIEELVVIFLGDILEGVLDHHAEKEDTLLLSQQFALAISVLGQLLLRLPAPSIIVYGVVGNHGRWPNQKRMPTVGRESNFDRLVYTALESIVTASDASHIQFDLRESSRQLIEVRQSLIQIAHGDQLRGGEYCLTGFKREAYNSALRLGPQGRMPDLFIVGDKHVSVQIPVGNAAFLINGSLVGEDLYGQRFAPTKPSQTLFWVGETRGKFLQADIDLTDATISASLPYDLSKPLQQLLSTYR